MQRRIGTVVRSYEQQGFHRTGTAVDRISGDWLADEVRQIGLKPEREEFQLSRIDPVGASLVVNDRRIEGLPLVDGAFTDLAGIAGHLGALDSDASIGLAEVAPNAAGADAVGEARRRNRHRAIVVVTRGARPGFCPSNADSFLHPFGPPVLQVASEEASFSRRVRTTGFEISAHGTCRTHADPGIQRRHDGFRNKQEPCAPGRDDTAKRLVVVRERALRRPGLLAGDHARDARRQTCPGRPVCCFKRPRTRSPGHR